MPPPERFVRISEEYGLAFEPGEVERYGRYLTLLLDANERMNLTTVTDPEWVWVRHIFDSLTLVPFVHAANAQRAVDVGTGGGLPGVPLAIAMPEIQITLIDATGKKVTFLREVCEDLGLRNVMLVNARAETAAHEPAHRERYDVAVSRAVGKLQVLLEYTAPFVKVGGHIIAIKGEKAPQEIADAKRALHHLHCQHTGTRITPTGSVVVIEKQRSTPKKYPRRPGEPKRNPLT